MTSSCDVNTRFPVSPVDGHFEQSDSSEEIEEKNGRESGQKKVLPNPRIEAIFIVLSATFFQNWLSFKSNHSLVDLNNLVS